MIFAVCYLLIVVLLAWFRPLWAIAVTSNAFLVNAMIGAEAGTVYILVGLGGPLVCFLMICTSVYMRRGEISLPLGVESLFVLLLLIVLLASSIYASEPDLSINVTLRYLVLCLSYFFVIRIAISSEETVSAGIKDFAFGIMLVGVFASIYAIWHGTSASLYVIRLTIGMASPIPLSILAGQSLLVALYFLISEIRWLHRVLYFGLALILIYVLILTNTRSTILGVLFSALVFMFFARRHFEIDVYIKLVFGVVVVGGLVAVFLGDSSELYERAYAGFSRVITGDLGESEADRIMAWSYALNVFSDNLIFGVGAGNFGQYYIAYPHNIFLEIMAENGFIGLFALSGLMFLSFRSVARNNGGVWMLVSCLFVLHFFIAQVSLTLWMHKFLFIWCSVLLMQNHFKERSLPVSNSQG